MNRIGLSLSGVLSLRQSTGAVLWDERVVRPCREESMRAIYCEQLGGPEHLVLREVASPTPGPGQVKVALRARGVSFVDVLMIAGQYQVKRELPFIPGGEDAGVVLETGSGVEHIKPGDRVLVPG